MSSIPISRPTALVAASVLLVALVLAGHRLAETGTAGGSPEALAPAAPVEAVAAAPATRQVVVHVVGAVRRPGLLRLPDGARVADAVRRAGGATRKADLAGVNLAAPVVDGTQILVPLRIATPGTGTVGATGLPSLAGPGVGPKLSLSSATVEELLGLPGVGPITAQKIVDHRTQHGPFASVEDLDAVSGIGPKRIEQLRDLVTP